ncbi:MAG: hypothetical protein KDI66_04070 [Xanthomonadales bacterium]|nr:hypothetical protein [Xanthomonadales bacterium]
MSYLKQIDLSLDDAQSAHQVIDELIKANRYDRLGLILNSAIESQAYAALVAARFNDARKNSILDDLFRSANLAIRMAESAEFEVAQISRTVRFEMINIYAVFGAPLGRPANKFPVFLEWLGLQGGDRYLDALITLRLGGNKCKAEWEGALDRLRYNKRARLCVDTYAGYSAVLDAAENGDLAAAMTNAGKVGELFGRRRRDAFYAGGPANAGGGPANEYVFDYQLAAIQRFYFASPAPGAEMHWW